MRLVNSASSLTLLLQAVLGLVLGLVIVGSTTGSAAEASAASAPAAGTGRASNGDTIVDKSKKMAVQWTQNEEYVKVVLSTGKVAGTPTTRFGRRVLSFDWDTLDGSGKRNKFQLRLAGDISPKRSKWSKIEKGVAFMLRKAQAGTWQKLAAPGMCAFP